LATFKIAARGNAAGATRVHRKVDKEFKQRVKVYVTGDESARVDAPEVSESQYVVVGITALGVFLTKANRYFRSGGIISEKSTAIKVRQAATYGIRRRNRYPFTRNYSLF